MLKDYHCRVLENRETGNQLFVLRLQPTAPDRFECKPGQFVMIDLPTPVFFFRRPMSVLQTHSDGSFDIFYKVHGQGTAMMSQFETGQSIKVLGPLGNTWAPPQNPKTALLIGGGIGIAPIYFLGKALNKETGSVPHCFYGVRSTREVGLEADLDAVFGQHLHISTDDGSQGFHGHVGQLLQEHQTLVQAAEDAYICGPTVMMKACQDLLSELNPNIRVQVSLEEMMPCGTGACTGCVVFRTDRELPSKTCVEGPIFDARSLQWETPKTPAKSCATKKETPCSL